MPHRSRSFLTGAVSCILALLVFSCSTRADDESPSDAAIKEAITILEARQAKTQSKADKNKIAKAIETLEKQLSPDQNPADKPEAAKVTEISPEALRKKFGGKAAFNSKTGELTLVYDFKNKDQLKDFSGEELELKKNVVRIAAGDKMRHVVGFASGNVTGTFVSENTEGGHIIMGFNRGFFGYEVLPDNRSNFHIYSHAQRVGEFKSNWHSGTPMTLSFSVNEKRARMTIGKKELGAGRREKEPAGCFVFMGGPAGMKVSSLVISGIPEEDWLQDFLKEEE